MADETEQARAGEVAETTEAQPTVTIETLQEQMQKLAEANEKQKSEIAGLNKANSTQKNAYDELLKNTETEAQTKAREADEARQQAENDRNDFLNQKAEFSKRENEFNIKLKASELGLNLEVVNKLGFNTIEQLEAYKETLTEVREQAGQETAKNIEKELSGKRESFDSSKQTEQLSPLEMKIINRR